MKLLIISSNTGRASFKQRIGVYIDVLRNNGIDPEVAKLPSSFLARHRLYRQAANYDGVFLHKKGLNLFDAMALRKHSKKLIYNFDDAVMYSHKTSHRDSGLRLRPWRRSVKLADLVIVGSSYLAQHAQRFNTSVEILPIGLKVSDYKIDPPPKADDKIRLVWIGSKSTLRYLMVIKPALEEIGSRFNNVVLRIICDDFFDLEKMAVEKLRWFQETRVVNLAECDIGLAPLPDDRFTRGKCSFKVLEYAAAGLPVVVSPVGTNSDYVLDGITGFFATDINEWVGKVTQLIESHQLRMRMGLAAREKAVSFDITVIGKRLCEIISKCISGGKS